jgi:DNA-binding response OmpR family regulator
MREERAAHDSSRIEACGMVDDASVLSLSSRFLYYQTSSSRSPMPRKPSPKGRIHSRKKTVASISAAELEILSLFVRSSLASPGTVLTEATVGRVRADFVKGTMTCDGKPVATSAKELQLLHYLFSRAGELVSRDDIYRDVWKYDTPPISRSIDNYILQLRKKIESDPASPRHLHTLRGGGYRLAI